MTDPATDAEFEAFLQRRTVLPNAMSADRKLEPPANVDAAVLSNARDAIRDQLRAQPQTQLQRVPRWATPLAIAATILLCLSIVLNIRLNTNRPSGDTATDTAPGAGAPAPVAAKAEAPAAAARDLEETKTTASRESRREEPAGPAGLSAKAPFAAPAAPSAAMPTPSVSPAAAPAAPLLADNRDPGSIEVTAQRQMAKRKTDHAVSPHPTDPKAWLRGIDALRAQGKTAQADAEMQRFRAAFPAYATKPAARGEPLK